MTSSSGGGSGVGAATLVITAGGILVYSGLKGVSVPDILKGVTGDTLDARGGRVKNAVQGVGGVTDAVDTAINVSGQFNIVQMGEIAKKMGLTPGENPHFGGVCTNSCHVSGSYHYRGRAIDVSGGTAEEMSEYANYLDDHFGNRLTELFWNGVNPVNRKYGKRVPQWFVSDHTDHVHVAI